MRNRKLLTSIIHDNNHTQTIRVCKINSNNIGKSIINISYNSNGIYNNLYPGIYLITIGSTVYCFDLYVPIQGSSTLYIKSPYNAYAVVVTEKYPIILYKVTSSVNDSITELDNTVNDYISMIVMDGLSEIKIIDDDNTIISNNSEITSYKDSDYNTYGSLDFIVLDASSTTEQKKLVSISNILIKTTAGEINIPLKDSIKSLPNGVCDTFILNAEQYQYHLILKTAVKLFTGTEDWQYIKSNDASYLFFLEDSTVKFENSNNNMTCSHFSTVTCNSLIANNCNESGISTSYGSYENGIFVRIFKDDIEYNGDILKSFKKWINNQLIYKTPFMVQYPLSNYIYKTYLLDEYHIHTVYPKTNIEIDDNYDISYFYKALII